jgi:imidazoleglycerol-phosphate dehydratase
MLCADQQQKHQERHLALCEDLAKPAGRIETGVGFLDHMIDQLNSHAQIGVTLTIGDRLAADDDDGDDDAAKSPLSAPDVSPPSSSASHIPSHYLAMTNRHKDDQARLMRLVGSKLGSELRRLLVEVTSSSAATFSCPLDEALVECCLEKVTDNGGGGGGEGGSGILRAYTLPPFGKYRRERIGCLETRHLAAFWSSLAAASGLNIALVKVRGDNAHHIVESSFKAFSRALRNLLDGVVDIVGDFEQDDQCASKRNERDALARRYGPSSGNWKAGVALSRTGFVSRQTKETSIRVSLALDGGEQQLEGEGGSQEEGRVRVLVSTGVRTLDAFLTELAAAARVSLEVECDGDLWIDEHHTTEDVAIALGQAIDQALGAKAGLNRMWTSRASSSQSGGAASIVQVTMDLSNRPDLVHNLFRRPPPGLEMAGDLSLEMMEHVLQSLTVNARMTVHIVENESGGDCDPMDTILATARAFGSAFFYCASVDLRRAGATASSKGTLSV